MRAFELALALFVLTSIIGGLNESGLFVTKLPNEEMSITESDVVQVIELPNKAVNESQQTLNPLEKIKEAVSSLADVIGLRWLLTGGKVLVSAFKSGLTIIPLMKSYGIPDPVIAMVQIPIWLIYMWGAVQFWTNRSTKHMR